MTAIHEEQNRPNGNHANEKQKKEWVKPAFSKLEINAGARVTGIISIDAS